jgi:hypothetical protein
MAGDGQTFAAALQVEADKLAKDWWENRNAIKRPAVSSQKKAEAKERQRVKADIAWWSRALSETADQKLKQEAEERQQVKAGRARERADMLAGQSAAEKQQMRKQSLALKAVRAQAAANKRAVASQKKSELARRRQLKLESAAAKRKAWREPSQSNLAALRW